MREFKNNKWVTVRELKPLSDTARFKTLCNKAKAAGLIIDLEDSELVTLISDSGIVFNDTLDYDSVNTSDAYDADGRKEFFDTFAGIIEHYKRCT
jgi:hypothetical protein